MIQNQIKFANTTASQWKRIFATAIIMLLLMTFSPSVGIVPAMAAAAGGINTVMTVVIDIVSTASKAIGVVIVIWGVFQIILAMRREDSEAIGKQITTVVVGGVLTGFGLIANNLYAALG